jgi:hypothetical protein
MTKHKARYRWAPLTEAASKGAIAAPIAAAAAARTGGRIDELDDATRRYIDIAHACDDRPDLGELPAGHGAGSTGAQILVLETEG